jgi:HK97 gp10 family phage protein
VQLKFEVKGGQKLSALLRALGRRTEQQVTSKVLMQAAKPIVAEAKRLVRKRTRAVERNIYATPVKGEAKPTVYISVRKHAWRAKFLEFGFVHAFTGKFVGTFPFLRPAFDTQRGVAFGLIKSLLRVTIDNEARSLDRGGKK